LDKLKKTVLQGWDEVGIEMQALAEKTAKLKHREAVFKSKIAQLKAQMEQEIGPLDYQARTHERNIEEFTRANLDDIRGDGKMSWQCPSGTIKTKEFDDFDFPDDDDLVAAIKEFKLKDMLKTEEKPLRSVIKAMGNKNPSLLEKLGVKVTPGVKIIIKTI
jgi:hypothetical protein